jgi:hypothetical protein
MFESRPRLIGRAACIAFLVAAVLAGAFASPADGVRRPKSRVFSAIKAMLKDGVHPLPQRATRGTFILRGSSTGRTSRARSLTIDRPVALPGDVMIVVVTARLSGSDAITSPTGWIRVRRDSNIGGAALSQVLQYKVAGVFEPDSYTWTFSSSVGATGGITAYGGVDVSAPIVTHGGLYSANTRLIAASTGHSCSRCTATARKAR